MILLYIPKLKRNGAVQ
uniref:Uncharacterized protein n=1 Tax=Anguilla anguilla TaxID=7936 RepID=A0A0E9XYF7_ANGAN